MIKGANSLLVIFLTAVVVLQSCKKEYSCEGCSTASTGNKLPVARAGSDQVLDQFVDRIVLDGTSSYDPDGKIVDWIWRKIAGPASFRYETLDPARSLVSFLEPGDYDFELIVTDDQGASARDTVKLFVGNKNSIRIDSLASRSYDRPCVMYVSDLDTLFSPGVKFDVYIRYYWTGGGGISFSGSFFEIDTIPDARNLNQPDTSYWYWYENRNGQLIIHYPNNILCEWDIGLHDVVIKWY